MMDIAGIVRRANGVLRPLEDRLKNAEFMEGMIFAAAAADAICSSASSFAVAADSNADPNADADPDPTAPGRCCSC